MKLVFALQCPNIISNNVVLLVKIQSSTEFSIKTENSEFLTPCSTIIRDGSYSPDIYSRALGLAIHLWQIDIFAISKHVTWLPRPTLCSHFLCVLPKQATPGKWLGCLNNHQGKNPSTAKAWLYYLIRHIINIKPHVSVPVKRLSSTIHKRIKQQIFLKYQTGNSEARLHLWVSISCAQYVILKFSDYSTAQFPSSKHGRKDTCFSFRWKILGSFNFPIKVYNYYLKFTKKLHLYFQQKAHIMIEYCIYCSLETQKFLSKAYAASKEELYFLRLLLWIGRSNSQFCNNQK